MDSLPPALRQGVEEFNRAYFFEAHETLEDLWRETSGPLRLFYQGLIQLAVALYHLSNGNRRGALNLLSKGLDKLTPFQPACRRFLVTVHQPSLDRNSSASRCIAAIPQAEDPPPGAGLLISRCEDGAGRAFRT
jgi:hypothetical protein